MRPLQAAPEEAYSFLGIELAFCLITHSKLLPASRLCKSNGQVLHLLFQLIALFRELCNQ